MASYNAPGFRGALLFDGATPVRGVGAFSFSWETAETRQRAKSGKLLIHRLSPYAGAAERIRKATISISWPSLLGDDIDFLNDLVAWGGPFAFTPWIMVSESFWVPASVASSGILSRLDAYTQLPSSIPAGSGTDFQARGGYSLAARGETITLGTADTVNNRTPWTGPTPSEAKRIWVAHAPIFLVAVAEDQPQFPQPAQQGQVLKLEEV